MRALKTTPPLYLPIISLAPLRTNPILPPLVLRKYYAKTDFQANIEPNIAAIIPASIASHHKYPTQFGATGLPNEIATPASITNRKKRSSLKRQNPHPCYSFESTHTNSIPRKYIIQILRMATGCRVSYIHTPNSPTHTPAVSAAVSATLKIPETLQNAPKPAQNASKMQKTARSCTKLHYLFHP